MYTEKDFKKCVFNPMVSTGMLKTYPKLSEIIDPEWTADENLDSILRYVVMTYDPASPFVTQERDLNYRKSSAADAAGFDLDNTELLTSIYNCTYELVPELVVKYLMRFAKSKEFAALVISEHCFWEATQHLISPIKGEDSKKVLEAVQKKSALKDEMDKDIARIDKYQKSFFGGDDAMEQVFKRKSFSSPEKMLKSTSNV